MPDLELPQNLEAEEALLGAILLDPGALPRILMVLPDGQGFFYEKHRWIYDAILAIFNRQQAIDFLTVCDELERQGKLEETGGAAFITSLLNWVPTSVHAEHYARIVARTWSQRRLILAAGQIAQIGHNRELEPEEAYSQAIQALLEAGPTAVSKGVGIGQLAMDYWDRIEVIGKQSGGMIGIPTGYRAIDSILGGLQGGDLVLLAARPSVGKTALALGIAARVAKRGFSVSFFSLEMSADQVVQRLISAESGISSSALRQAKLQDEQYPLLVETIDGLTHLPLFVEDSPILTPALLRSRLLLQRPDLAIVDYLQLMRPDRPAKDLYHAITAISQALKAIARELNLPLLVLSQLSRAVEQRADKRPLLSDLRDSGAIEQDADAVLFLYRDELYHEDSKQKGVAELIVAKHRNGPTGKAMLHFRYELAAFTDVEIEHRNLTELL